VEGNDALLLIDFVNLKIKSTQSFKDTHRGRVYVSDHTCISTFVLCFSNKRSIDKKNSFSTQSRQSIKAHLKVEWAGWKESPFKECVLGDRLRESQNQVDSVF
jgi:hypothetical protein